MRLPDSCAGLPAPAPCIHGSLTPHCSKPLHHSTIGTPHHAAGPLSFGDSTLHSACTPTLRPKSITNYARSLSRVSQTNEHLEDSNQASFRRLGNPIWMTSTLSSTRRPHPRILSSTLCVRHGAWWRQAEEVRTPALAR